MMPVQPKIISWTAFTCWVNWVFNSFYFKIIHLNRLSSDQLINLGSTCIFIIISQFIVYLVDKTVTIRLKKSPEKHV